MPQSPLPPERELCLEFGIGRMRERRALNVLEDAGLAHHEDEVSEPRRRFPKLHSSPSTQQLVPYKNDARAQ